MQDNANKIKWLSLMFFGNALVCFVFTIYFGFILDLRSMFGAAGMVVLSCAVSMLIASGKIIPYRSK